MITLDNYANRTVGVMGLGKAGQATVRSLLAGGAAVVAWDDNVDSRQQLQDIDDDKLEILPPVKWLWEEVCVAVLSPGIPLTHPKPHDVLLNS